MNYADQLQQQVLSVVQDVPRGVDGAIDECRLIPGTNGVCSPKIDRHIRAFKIYSKYAVTGTRFLDWGCLHALDSCMIRMLNPEASIDGCDIKDEIVEQTRAFAGMNYTKLTHAWKLPYEDQQFDRVISSGVLEHAPMTYPSLTELNRVLEPGGFLIITFLPNQASYTEFISRNFIKAGQHTRLYTKARLRTLLLDHGFEPVEIGFHQLLPSLSSHRHFFRSDAMNQLIKSAFKMDPVLERIWPLKLFSANLYAIAKKKLFM